MYHFMKTNKFKILALAFIVALFMVLPTAVKAATTMPADVDGTITLTEDVVLTSKYVVDSEKTLTIDLNGHTIAGPDVNSDYTIENLGDLTIVDNGTEKGKIEGISPSASCIRNYGGTLSITGVTVTSKGFAAIKNEPNSTMTLDNCNLSLTYTSSKTEVETVVNAGTAIIKDSTINTSYPQRAIRVTCTDTTDSDTTVTNTKMAGGRYGVDVLESKGGSQKVTVKDCTFEVKNGSAVSVSTKANATVNVSGDLKGNETAVCSLVKGSFSRYNYVAEGTTITCIGDAEEITLDDCKIPEGVTVVIPDEKTVKLTNGILGGHYLTILGTLQHNGTKEEFNIYNEAEKEYTSDLYSGIYNAEKGAEIKLLADVKVKAGQKTEAKNTYAVPKNVTIDLNGHTITGTLTVNAEKEVTIKDSSSEKKGDFNGTITAKGTLNYNLEQSEAKITKVDGCTVNVLDVVDLVKNDDDTYSIKVKPADYTNADKAKADANAKLNDGKKYTDATVKALQEALGKIEEGLPITKQDELDKQVKAVEDAIKNLKEEQEEPKTEPKTEDKTTTKTETKTTTTTKKVTVAKPTLEKVTAGKQKATAKWKKVSGATGYEVYMATSKNGKYSKVKAITNAKTVSYTKTGLKANKTYYFKVRAYKTVSGKKVYSSYSNIKSAKTYRYYKVKKGDNLSKLAKKFKTTVKKLVKLNNIKNKNLIKPGQILRIS